MKKFNSAMLLNSKIDEPSYQTSHHQDNLNQNQNVTA